MRFFYDKIISHLSDTVQADFQRGYNERTDYYDRLIKTIMEYLSFCEHITLIDVIESLQGSGTSSRFEAMLWLID